LSGSATITIVCASAASADRHQPEGDESRLREAALATGSHLMDIVRHRLRRRRT
jgi:hypothetical protein